MEEENAKQAESRGSGSDQSRAVSKAAPSCCQKGERRIWNAESSSNAIAMPTNAHNEGVSVSFGSQKSPERPPANAHLPSLLGLVRVHASQMGWKGRAETAITPWLWKSALVQRRQPLGSQFALQTFDVLTV